MSEDDASPKTDADAASGPKEHRAPEGAEITATWTNGEQTIPYRATAGWTLLRKDDDTPSAEMFSVAYLADPAPDAADGERFQRPVTFVFNGGPGASSAYLHMGVVGPSRVAFPPDGSTPALPTRLVPNEDSWLAFTDLVFIDPVGTGFSRTIPEKKDGEAKAPERGDANEFWGYEKDLRSLTEFMGRWLSENRRWGSPVFIAGESYGGYRVGRLARMAQEVGGIGLSGAILISPALELAGLDPNDYEVLAWVDVLPTMALTAVHHGRSRAFAAGTPLADVVAQAESFATTDFTTLLTRGASLPVLDRQRIFARQADLLGLPTDLVARAEGRIPIHVFVRELLRDERKVVGLYDATITATDPFPDRGDYAGADPTLSGIAPAFTSAVNRQLRGEIGVRTDREYVLSSEDAFMKWRNDAVEHFFVPPHGATDDLRYGLSLNPHMRAFITHGRFDLVTPFYGSDRLYNLMRLDPATADRVRVEHFGGGHMFYAWEQSRRAFSAAIGRFVADCLA